MPTYKKITDSDGNAVLVDIETGDMLKKEDNVLSFLGEIVDKVTLREWQLKHLLLGGEHEGVL